MTPPIDESKMKNLEAGLEGPEPKDAPPFVAASARDGLCTQHDTPPLYQEAINSDALSVDPNKNEMLLVSPHVEVSRDRVMRVASRHVLDGYWAGRPARIDFPAELPNRSEWYALDGSLTIFCYVEKVWVKAEKKDDPEIRKPDKLTISIKGQIALPGYFAHEADVESRIPISSWIEDAPLCPSSNIKYVTYETGKILERARHNSFASFWGFVSRYRSRYLGWRCFADNDASIPWFVYCGDNSGCPCGSRTLEVTAWSGGRDRRDAHLMFKRHIDAGACLGLYPWDLELRQMPNAS